MSDNDGRPLGEWLRAAYEPGAGCPPPERFLEAEMGDLPEAERRRLEEHARTCPACAAERDLARLFSAAPEETGAGADDLRHVVARLEAVSPLSPLSSVSSGVGSEEADSAGARVVPFPSRPAQPAVSSPAPARPAAPWRAWRVAAAAVLAIGGAMTLWTVRPGAPPPLPPPPGESEVLRGTEVETLSPSGEIAAIPGELQWRERTGALSYRVTLRTVDDQVLWEAMVPASPASVPVEVRGQLHPAVAYIWTVEALDATGARLAVSAPTRFRAAPAPGVIRPEK